MQPCFQGLLERLYLPATSFLNLQQTTWRGLHCPLRLVVCVKILGSISDVPISLALRGLYRFPMAKWCRYKEKAWKFSCSKIIGEDSRV